MKALNSPPRRVVEEAIDRETFRARVCRRDIIDGQYRDATRARWRVWRAVLTSTGCSVYGLAAEWGCERQAVRRAMIQLEAERAA